MIKIILLKKKIDPNEPSCNNPPVSEGRIIHLDFEGTYKNKIRRVGVHPIAKDSNNLELGYEDRCNGKSAIGFNRKVGSALIFESQYKNSFTKWLNNSFTISIWLKDETRPPMNGWHQILMFKDPTPENTSAISFRRNGNLDILEFIVNQEGERTLTIQFDTIKTGPGGVGYGDWVHYALVVNKPDNTVQLFQDGIKHSIIGQSGKYFINKDLEFENKAEFILGADFNYAGTWYGGMDEFILFDRALKKDEVLDLAFNKIRK